jgi:hypothetical protein
MKHIKRVTVAKAAEGDVWSEIGAFFEDLWKNIKAFFKGE